jgi:hypothetical protein
MCRQSERPTGIKRIRRQRKLAATDDKKSASFEALFLLFNKQSFAFG